MKDKVKNQAVKIVASVAFALLFTLTFGTYGGWFDLIMVVVMTTVLSIAIGKFIDHKDAGYTNRMNSAESVEWDVLVNDVKVGTVTDAEYAAMQRFVLRDRRTAWAQLMNLGRICLVILDKAVVLVPLMMFWGTVGLAFIDPVSFSTVLHAIQNVNADAITSAVGTFLQTGLALTVLVVTAMVFLGYRFGYRNYYSVAVADLLRRHCNTPTEGVITLMRETNGRDRDINADVQIV